MIYSNERFIKAHQDIRNPYYNHSYDRYVRYAFCFECVKTIGEQKMYPDVDTDFHFCDERDNYTHCPYCGHEFQK